MKSSSILLVVAIVFAASAAGEALLRVASVEVTEGTVNFWFLNCLNMEW